MKKKITIIIALVLTASLVFAMSACGSKANDTDSDKADEGETATAGTLVLGCDDAFPPMGFDDGGKIVGFDIDLAQAVADKLGLKLVVKPIDWSAKELELTSKNIDVIWNGYSITADRIDKVTFTKPYLKNSQQLVVKTGSKITSKADLAGKIVGVQADSAALDLIEADPEFKDSLKDLRVYDDYQEALQDLKSSDRIDAVAVDKILIEYIMKQSPDTFKILDESLGEEYFGIGCRKDDTKLADDIDKALEELQADGTTLEISKKWFAGDQDIVITDVPRLTKADVQ
jgi:polar amino acid transport system substrate-binding protein